jgi:arylsulfatase A
MPNFQLYNLKTDPSEKNNLFSDNPAKVNELKELMAKYIEQGRSTPGKKQDNEGMDNWPEIDWIMDSDSN